MTTRPKSFGYAWFDALATSVDHDAPAGLRIGDYRWGADRRATVLAVVPDPTSRFPRARDGEVGLVEGWAFAEAVTTAIDADRAQAHKRPIVVVIDVPSQAYGYVEELAGIHQSLAAATNALATARLSGHPTVGIIVGQAVSGAFLAIGLQAGRLLALDHDGVVVQVMSKPAAARITRRSIAELDAAAALVPATAYDIASFTRLGAVHELLPVEQPDAPTADDVARVRTAIDAAVEELRRTGDRTLRSRLDSAPARHQRAASILVRDKVDEQWDR